MIRKGICLLGLGSLLAFTACNDWLGDNRNPGMLSEAPEDALLTAIIEQTANNHYNVALTTSLYVQHLASPNTNETDRYGRVTLNDCWSSLYGCMANASDLYRVALRNRDNHYAGAALVMLSYNALMTTDLWGDIPFTEAFDGADIIEPHYDTQEAVYDTIVKNIDRAIELFGLANSHKVFDGDILYNNQPQQWKRFAYSLKARTLMHLSRTASFDAEKILNAVDSAFTSIDGNAELHYSGNKNNPWYTLVYGMVKGGVLNGYLSAQLIESMKGNLQNGLPFDPRLTMMTDTLPGGGYAGTINGSAPPQTGFCTLTLHSWPSTSTAPILLLTYPEIKLIEAEASLLNGELTRAKDAFVTAIRSHMEMLDVDSNEANTYLQAVIQRIDETSLTINDIAYQKWLILYLQPEAWTELRRNKYALPGMTLPANCLTDRFIQRILYPDTEIALNSNCPKSSSQTDPLWWHQ